MPRSRVPEHLPEHSPVGASGASRWMKCPASVGLSEGVSDEESEFAAEGSAAHLVGETCLKNGYDAWEALGFFVMPDFREILDAKDAKKRKVEGKIEVTQDMTDAVQVYLNGIRSWHPDRNQGNFYIERDFHCPTIHPYFYGKSDAVYVDFPERALHVWDYKHGAGILVTAFENAQGSYYGVGILEDLDLWDKVDTVYIHIAQPRCYGDPLTVWSISTSELEDWLEDTLLPAMEIAYNGSDKMKSGEHCRFCPVRWHDCPQMRRDFKRMKQLMAKSDGERGAKELSNKEIGEFLTIWEVMKIRQKALGKVAFGRLQAGKKLPGVKLAQGKKNRVWKDGADAAIKKELGKKAMTAPELKSPAQIDKMMGGEKLSARWAFKPKGNLTVVPAGDARKEVSRDTKSMFKDVSKKGKK